MTVEEFSIQDLCDRTGLARRTIHFYIQQGILPPPTGSGMGARYRREHLLRLQLIPILRHQGLRLDAIRVKFTQAEPAELERIFEEAQETLAQVLPTIHEPTLGQPCLVFSYPEGILLMIPDNLSPETREKAHRLLQTAQQVFSTQS